MSEVTTADPLALYATLSTQIKTLEAEKERLKPLVLDQIDDSPDHIINNNWGYFSAMERKSFEYSDTIKTMEATIKDLKKKEEQSGVATVKSISRYPVFSERKEK